MDFGVSRFAVLAGLIGCVGAADVYNATNVLLRNLTGNENALIRPSSDAPVRVSVRIVINSLEPTDGKVSHLDAEGWLDFRWNDPHLAWKPADYSGVTSVMLPIRSIWVPDMTYLNNADATFTNEQKNVHVFSDGTVIWKPKIKLSFRYLNTANEDVKFGTMAFASWSFTADAISWNLILNVVDTTMSDTVSMYLIDNSTVAQQFYRYPHGIKAKVIVRLRIIKNPLLTGPPPPEYEVF